MKQNNSNDFNNTQMDDWNIERLGSYKDQALSRLEEYLSSNKHTKNIVDHLSQIDSQTYNIIGISTITLVSMFYIIDKLFGNKTTSSAKGKKKRKKKKAKSPLQTWNAKIDEILNDTTQHLVPEFTAFKQDFELGKYKDKKKIKKNTKEDPNFQVLYFNEILLRKLMELDEVDTLGNDDLRSKRKNAIKYIQDFHKQLDDIKNRI